jgi:hypothetical protein
MSAGALFGLLLPRSEIVTPPLPGHRAFVLSLLRHGHSDWLPGPWGRMLSGVPVDARRTLKAAVRNIGSNPSD